MKKKIYVASSWRNIIQQEIVKQLRHMGHEVYDFKNPRPGDDVFRWSQVGDFSTPENYLSLIYSAPRCREGFLRDKTALDWCDTCVLLLPCGRSAHLEAGYAAGRGKTTLVLLHEDKFEPELMYLLNDRIFTKPVDLFETVGRV